MHRIRRVQLELTVHEEPLAAPLLDRASRLHRQGIAPLLARVCDDLGDPVRLARLDRLEVDLGTLSLENLEHDLIHKLGPALRSALERALGPAAHPRTAQVSLELIESFARTGNLPWWADPGQGDPVAAALTTVISEDPPATLALLRGLADDPPALTRLARHCDDAPLAKLVAHASPAAGTTLRALLVAPGRDALALARMRPAILASLARPNTREASRALDAVLRTLDAANKPVPSDLSAETHASQPRPHLDAADLSAETHSSQPRPHLDAADLSAETHASQPRPHLDAADLSAETHASQPRPNARGATRPDRDAADLSGETYAAATHPRHAPHPEAVDTPVPSDLSGETHTTHSDPARRATIAATIVASLVAREALRLLVALAARLTPTPALQSARGSRAATRDPSTTPARGLVHSLAVQVDGAAPASSKWPGADLPSATTSRQRLDAASRGDPTTPSLAANSLESTALHHRFAASPSDTKPAQSPVLRHRIDAGVSDERVHSAIPSTTDDPAGSPVNRLLSRLLNASSSDDRLLASILSAAFASSGAPATRRLIHASSSDERAISSLLPASDSTDARRTPHASRSDERTISSLPHPDGPAESTVSALPRRLRGASPSDDRAVSSLLATAEAPSELAAARSADDRGNASYPDADATSSSDAGDPSKPGTARQRIDSGPFEDPCDLTSRPSGPESTSRPSGPESTSRPSGPESTSRPSGPESTSRPSGPESTDASESAITRLLRLLVAAAPSSSTVAHVQPTDVASAEPSITEDDPRAAADGSATILLRTMEAGASAAAPCIAELAASDPQDAALRQILAQARHLVALLTDSEPHGPHEHASSDDSAGLFETSAEPLRRLLARLDPRDDLTAIPSDRRSQSLATEELATPDIAIPSDRNIQSLAAAMSATPDVATPTARRIQSLAAAASATLDITPSSRTAQPTAAVQARGSTTPALVGATRADTSTTRPLATPRRPTPTRPLAARRGLAREGDLHVNDAGLVLLAPFLGRLFERTGLLADDGQFLEGAVMRAIAQLAYLATGDPSPAEYSVPLAKLLCGLRPDDEYTPGPPPTPEQLGECDLLLAAVVDHAPVLRDMSADGLRAAFLRRPGLLGGRDGAWLLRVERGPLDVLLTRLPWSWSWVRPAWMPVPLQVEW